MATQPGRPPLTFEEELNSILHAWLRQGARARAATVPAARRRALDKQLRPARRALSQLRLAILLLCSTGDRARFEKHLDEVSAAFDHVDTSTVSVAPRAAQRPSDHFVIEACRALMRRHRVSPDRVARYLIARVPALPKAKRDALFRADTHRTEAEQRTQARKRLANRLQPRSRRGAPV